jgi:PPOX class probable F420-dependent enzyme
MAYTVNSLPADATVTAITALPFRALGGQPPFEADELDAFLAGTHIAVLSYLRADGRPNQAPLWYAYRDGAVWFSVETTSAKLRALRRDPRVCVTVQDERPPYRAVIIEGTVELIDAGHDVSANQALALRYFGRLGAAKYDQLYHETRAGAGATLLRLVPSEVKGFDNTRAIDRATLSFVRLRHRLPIPARWL